MRGDQYSARAEQLPIAEQIAERHNARIIEAAARLVEQEQIWPSGKSYDDRQSTPLTIRESSGRRVEQMGNIKAPGDRLGTGTVTRRDLCPRWSCAEEEARVLRCKSDPQIRRSDAFTSVQ